MKIGIFGTFDVENYGDLLFPLIAEKELEKRLDNYELLRFSYYEKSSKNWIYDVISLADLQNGGLEFDDLDILIIGGGHLIRFDKSVADNYNPPHINIPHPTGYWLTPALAGIMCGKTVIWNAPGTSESFPAWSHQFLNFALSNSDYVAVRDRLSQQAVKSIGYTDPVKIVPDTAFSIGNHYPKEETKKRTEEILSAHKISDNYLIVQGTPHVVDLLNLLKSETNLFSQFDILVIPIGPVLGDSNSEIINYFPEVKKLEYWPTPEEIIGLVANSQGVLSMSLHLSITAICYGIPVLRPEIELGIKYSVLKESENVFYAASNNFGEIINFSNAVKSSDRNPCTLVVRAKKQINNHWNEIGNKITANKHLKTNFHKLYYDFNKLLRSQDNVFSTQEKQIDALNIQLADKDQEILFYSHSKSWQITRPIRRLMAFFRKILNI